MIRIGILGDIGSGKSYVASNFGYPVFNADKEVSKLYKNDKKIFYKLKKILPKYFNKFPIKKHEVLNAILDERNNLKKIVKIVHLEIRKKMNLFLKRNKNKKAVILDVPLLLENKINKKGDILIFVQSNKFDIQKKLKKRKNFDQKLLYIFKKIQFPVDYKKKKSQFIIKNDFTRKTVLKYVKYILKQL
jgi:dephospho-CoA kinase